MGAQVSSHDELVQELVRSTSERDVAAMRELTAAIADLVDYEQSGPEDRFVIQPTRHPPVRKISRFI